MILRKLSWALIGLSLLLGEIVANGQQKSAKLDVMPSAGSAVGLVKTATDGRWLVLSTPSMSSVNAESLKRSPEAGGGSIVYWEGKPGSSYLVILIADKITDGLATASVTLGGTAPADPTQPSPHPSDPNSPTTPATTKVDHLTYVYDKDQGPVPRTVSAALAKLNAGTTGVAHGLTPITADEFEIHDTDGDNEVPDQFKVAKEQAEKAGLPSLVATSGGKWVRTVKSPKSEAEVLEAAK